MGEKGHHPAGGVVSKVLEAQLMRVGGWEEKDKLKMGVGKKTKV